jgi:hypothetical protein
VSSIRRHIYCKGKAAAFASVFCLFLVFSPGRARAQENSLQYISGQTTFFSGMEYSLQWRQGDPPPPSSGSLLLVIYHANRAVIKIPVSPHRREPETSPGQGIVFEAGFQYPELKPGNAIKTQAIILAQKKDDTWVKVFQAPFYFFSRQLQSEPRPFPPEPQAGIIDRSARQALTRLLQETGIPFSRVSSIHDFHGKWLFCSGLDFTADHSLFSELLDLAKKGIFIAVFPPLSGVFPVPGSQPGLLIRLGDQRLARTIDPRLNLTGGEKEFQNPAVFFQWVNSGREIAIRCSPAGAGFQWLELSFEPGTLLFCGWDVGSMSARNPSARLLVTKITDPRSSEAHNEQN